MSARPLISGHQTQRLAGPVSAHEQTCPPTELLIGIKREAWPAAHSITSSAPARTDGGIVNPSVLAAARFTTNSNTVGCSTASSDGFAPLRMRSTYMAARRYIPGKLVP